MKYTIWYMNQEFFKHGIVGYTYLKDNSRLPNPKNLHQTHTVVMEIPDAPAGPEFLEQIFTHMNGDWLPPRGEVHEVIKRLGHTVMSIGDIIQYTDEIGTHTCMADVFGFQEI